MFLTGSLKNTALIGCRCNDGNVFSRAVLITRKLSLQSKLLVTVLKDSVVSRFFFKIFKVVIAAGIHLFPYRTEKLSPFAPMVLRYEPGE